LATSLERQLDRNPGRGAGRGKGLTDRGLLFTALAYCAGKVGARTTGASQNTARLVSNGGDRPVFAASGPANKSDRSIDYHELTRSLSQARTQRPGKQPF
jgi:hypothetical protein